MSPLEEAVIKVLLAESVVAAEEQGDEIATISAGWLKKLWAAYEKRGEALEPFAMAADSLNHQQQDTDSARLTVTCGDLRAALDNPEHRVTCLDVIDNHLCAFALLSTQ